MTKIKILSLTLKLFIWIYMTGIVCLLYFIYTTSLNPEIPSVYQLYFCNSVFSSIAFIVAIYFLEKSCSLFIERTYFNHKSKLYLKRSGIILMALGTWGLASSFAIPETISMESLFKNFSSNIGSNITLFIIGFGLLAIADIIKKGEKLKQENDLTI